MNFNVKRPLVKDERKRAIHYTGYSSEDSLNKEDISFEDKKNNLIGSPKVKKVKLKIKYFFSLI